MCHTSGAKIDQDVTCIGHYRTYLDYLFIIKQNSNACFYSKEKSIVSLEFRTCTQYWAQICHTSGVKIDQDMTYRGYMEYIAIVDKNKTQLFFQFP